MLDRVAPMSKPTVTRLFVGASLAMVAGLVVGIATAVSALAGGAIALGGPAIVTVDGPAIVGMLPWLAIAALFGAGGGIAAVVSWIGAMLNTARLDDKSWFVALLVLGLLSFGWLAMVAYVVAGPDGTSPVATDRVVTNPGPI